MVLDLLWHVVSRGMHVASIIWTEREVWNGRRRVHEVSLQLNRATLPACQGQAWSSCSLEGGLGTWSDELEATREVTVAGIRVVTRRPQHYTCDAGDGPELRSLQDSVPKQP